MLKKALLYSLVIAVFVIFAQEADAQCVMCKMNAENAAENGGSEVGEGINSGIVYLMGIPYGLLLIGAGVFFRHKIFGFIKR